MTERRSRPSGDDVFGSTPSISHGRGRESVCGSDPGSSFPYTRSTTASSLRMVSCSLGAKGGAESGVSDQTGPFGNRKVSEIALIGREHA
jgi:hypothetical protein